MEFNLLEVKVEGRWLQSQPPSLNDALSDGSSHGSLDDHGLLCGGVQRHANQRAEVGADVHLVEPQGGAEDGGEEVEEEYKEDLHCQTIRGD